MFVLFAQYLDEDRSGDAGSSNSGACMGWWESGWCTEVPDSRGVSGELCTSAFSKKTQKTNLGQVKFCLESRTGSPRYAQWKLSRASEDLAVGMDGKAIKKTFISSGGPNHPVKGNIHCKTSTKTF